jgi:hypothetical protein
MFLTRKQLRNKLSKPPAIETGGCLYRVFTTGLAAVADVHHIPILHNVFLAFQPQLPFAACIGF